MDLQFPKYLSIQTTSICNAACVFCPYEKVKDLFPPKIMDMGLYRKIIDECSHYQGVKRLILYMNNEPLTDPYLIERINYAKKKLPWANVHFLTNGLLLTDEMAEKLLQSQVDWVGISFHGIKKETIEKTMGIPYELALERINSFIEKAKKRKDLSNYVMISFLRHRYLGEEEKNEAAAYWRDKGVQRISYFDAPVSRAGNVEHLPKVFHQQGIVGCKSIWADEMLHVVEDGKVVLCCMDWRRETILGDLGKESIYEVWNGRRKKTWEMIKGKQSMPDDFLCKKCEEAVVQKDKERLLLVSLPPWGVDTPPLGIACLSSYLLQKGIGVDAFDLNIELFNAVSDQYRYLWGMNYSHWWRDQEKFSSIRKDLDRFIEPLIERILQSPHKIIGFSLPTNCSDLLLEEVVKRIKEKDKSRIIVLGGVSVSIKEQRADLLKGIEDFVDYCGLGQGEQALYELVKRIFQGRRQEAEEIKSILVKGNYGADKLCAQVANLNALAPVMFEVFDLKKYLVPESLPMEFSRGCIGNCPFCDFKSISPTFKSKTPSYILHQIQLYKEKYNIDHLTICDASINGDMKVLREVCDLLINSNISVNISALAIPRKEMTPDLLIKMRKAGFYRLEYGVESGSDNILKGMRKIFNADIAERVTRDTYQAGIKTYLYFIVGFPGETEEDFEQTKKFIERNAKFITMIKSINPLYIMAGSEIFRHPEKFGITFPRDQADSRWYARNNTVEIRKERVRRLKEHAEFLDVSFTEEAENLEFTKPSLQKKDSAKHKILLAICPCWGVENPPLGLAALAAYLQQRGVEAQVLDLNIELYHKALGQRRELWKMSKSHLWWDHFSFSTQIKPLLEEEIDWCVEEILKRNIDTIGFSVYAPNRAFTVEVTQRIKRLAPQKKIIVGGRGIYDVFERLVFPESSVDLFIVGEAEDSLYQLLCGNINAPGVVKDRNKEISPCYLQTLKDFPLISYEKFPLDRYQDPSIALLMNRGCIFQCAYCNDWRYIGRLRSRGAKDIYKEIEYHVNTNKIKKFTFNDQAINVNVGELNALCELLIDAPFKIEWIALAIPWKLLRYDLLLKMRRAGCITLNYGIESGSDRVLRLMNKRLKVEEVEEVLANTRKAGINTQVNFIVGFPGETEEDFAQTKEFIARNRGNICGITNLNACNVTLNSDLFVHSETYGIKFGPHYPHQSDTHWLTKDGDNTYELRTCRAGELLEKTKQYGIPVFTTNVVQGQEEAATQVVLIMCPMWDAALPPLGISYLASYLESRGSPVDILDINIQAYAHSNPERKALWKMENYNLWSWEELYAETKKLFEKDVEYYVQQILEKDYKVIGFSLYGANVLFSIELASRLKQKKPDLFIVFGGPSCSFLHEHPDMPVRCMVSFKTQKSMVPPGVVDVFVLGEGEEALFKLVCARVSGTNISSIPGVISYANGKYVFSSRPQLMKNLDSLPYPVWEKLPLQFYSSKNTLPILFSRGCVNRCSFCNDWKIWQGKYRCRSALNIFQEMKIAAEKLKIKTFQCNDLLFNGNLKMLEELADYLAAAKLDINWSAQGVTRRDMSLSLLKKLKRSGLTWLTYGIESLSENVLKKMNKKYNLDDIQRTLKNTKKSGVGVSANFIVGFPNETEEDFNVTKNNLVKIRDYVDEISSLSPCYITTGIDLEKSPEKFSVRLPAENWFYHWEGLGGKNTYAIRKNRAKELFEFAKSIGITVRFTGIYDEQDKVEQVVREHKETRDADLFRTGNKADFLLINLPPWAQESPHIGVAYLGSYLRRKGLRMKVLDLNKRFYLEHPELKMLWHVENKNFWSNKDTFGVLREIFKEDIEKAINEILSFDCGNLGFSVVDPKERLTIEFIERITERAPGKKIILGGPATSTNEQRKIFLDCIPKSIDAFVVGEGEETLFQLLDRLLNKKGIQDVPGCYVKHNGRWNYKQRLPLCSIDSIPFPTYEEFDLDLYGKSLLVEWSRGCKGSCTFCKNYRLFAKYRSKTQDSVLNELRHHQQKYNINEFTVVDNILNGDIEKLNNICDSIIKENMQIRWTGQIAPHQNMHFDLFKNMKKAGCLKLQIGLESASHKVLKLMRKTFTPEISERNIRLAKKAGIKTEIFIITGFPGETEIDFRETYDFVKRNAAYIDTLKSINTLHLIAGTEVYEKSGERFNMKPLPKDNWHYLWQTYDGNTYPVRKERTERLLDLASDLGIEVMETNIREGKEGVLEAIRDKKDLGERLIVLRDSIDSLQSLPQKREIVGKKRGAFKWLVLIFVSAFTIFYITYFRIYMILRNKVLLGGRKKIA